MILFSREVARSPNEARLVSRYAYVFGVLFFAFSSPRMIDDPCSSTTRLNLRRGALDQNLWNTILLPLSLPLSLSLFSFSWKQTNPDGPTRGTRSNESMAQRLRAMYTHTFRLIRSRL